MLKNKGYTAINLPKALVEELKIWRQAFMIAYGRTVSYGEMIYTMLGHLDADEPDIVQAMDMLITAHPEMAARVGKYRGADSDDEDCK